MRRLSHPELMLLVEEVKILRRLVEVKEKLIRLAKQQHKDDSE
jgi:hypothetical protein